MTIDEYMASFLGVLFVIGLFFILLVCLSHWTTLVDSTHTGIVDHGRCIVINVQNFWGTIIKSTRICK